MRTVKQNSRDLGAASRGTRSGASVGSLRSSGREGKGVTVQHSSACFLKSDGWICSPLPPSPPPSRHNLPLACDQHLSGQPSPSCLCVQGCPHHVSMDPRPPVRVQFPASAPRCPRPPRRGWPGAGRGPGAWPAPLGLGCADYVPLSGHLSPVGAAGREGGRLAGSAEPLVPERGWVAAAQSAPEARGCPQWGRCVLPALCSAQDRVHLRPGPAPALVSRCEGLDCTHLDDGFAVLPGLVQGAARSGQRGDDQAHSVSGGAEVGSGGPDASHASLEGSEGECGLAGFVPGPSAQNVIGESPPSRP